MKCEKIEVLSKVQTCNLVCMLDKLITIACARGK